MTNDIQLWMIVAFLGLLVTIQLISIILLLSQLRSLKSSLGNRTLGDIITSLEQTMDAVKRAADTGTELLVAIRPTIDEATVVSRRQLGHADQVVGEILDGVERINRSAHTVASVVGLPFRQLHALSAGLRSATAAFFGRTGNSHKRSQW